MIMMMTDPDRVALSAFLPCISVSFHSPIHANFNAHLPPECPPLQLSHILLPHPILVFGFTSQQICLFFSHFSSTFWHACQALHHFSRLLPLFFAQRLSAGLLPFFPLLQSSSQQLPKKTCNQSHIPSSSLHSLQASMRTRTCVRLSMYLLPVAVFISHQKEVFVREERHRSTKKRRA
jgi:hypothetical protein